MSYTIPPDQRPVTLTWITATIERHERTVPFGTLRTYLDHARERVGRPEHPDYARDLDLLKDTWLAVHETEILDYRHIRRITGHDLPTAPRLAVFTVTVIGEERHYGEPASTYVVSAPDLQAAKTLVTEHFIATCEKDLDLATGEERDPEVIVVEGPLDTFDGTPRWPEDAPGHAWTDLREDAEMLERAYRIRPAR